LLGLIIITWKQLRRHVVYRKPHRLLHRGRNKLTSNVIQEVFQLELGCILEIPLEITV
jgi:hypothetical protein